MNGNNERIWWQLESRWLPYPYRIAVIIATLITAFALPQVNVRGVAITHGTVITHGPTKIANQVSLLRWLNRFPGTAKKLTGALPNSYTKGWIVSFLQ